MAKTYVSAVKYQITANFEITGIVDKHDIIGAIFGQSEGMLGDDMDLKELQQGGKIGRIEIELKTHLGKTTGTVTIPSSMDKVQTSILAASIEAVDKVGPCDARFEVGEIKDMRSFKRQAITERAKELLKRLNSGLPETQVLTAEVKDDTRTAELQEYGKDSLSAGPGIESNEEIIIVEGRADVLNLLKHNIKNVVGMNGARVPETLVRLCENKIVTAFIDGDRGGELNLRHLQQFIKVAFVARAPTGKEVEELAGKEIVAALRKKFSVEERPRTFERSFGQRPTRNFQGRRKIFGRGGRSPRRSFIPRQPRDYERRESFVREPEQARPVIDLSSLGKFSAPMQELQGSLKARLLDSKGNATKEISVRDLLSEMQRTKETETVVFDGIVTKRLVEAAEKSGIKTIVGMKKGKVEETKEVKILTAA